MKHLKLFFALFAMLALGVGNAWADEYALYSGTITEGDYVIVYDGNAMNNTVSSSRLGYTAVTITDGKISNPDATIVWHIAPSGDYWTIFSANVNKYAASTGAKNKAQLLASGTDDKSLWTVSGSSTYEFVNKANAAANVNKNLRQNGTYGFACYATSTGGALSLYKKVEQSGGGETPEPDPDPTPDPEPEPDPTPDPGTGGTSGWVETAIGNISASDIVVVTMTNSAGTYAMANDKGTGAAPTAVPVTVNGDKLADEPADKLKWNITYSSGNLTIYPNGDNEKWLYCTATNNGVRVGTNANKIFTIDATSGYLKNTATTRYLGVYNNADWRCYTSTTTNIANQTLKFYKYVEPTGGETPEPVIVKTLKSIAVAGMKTTYEQGDIFKFDGTCTATYSVTKDGAAQADETAEVTPTSVSTPNMNTIGKQTVTVTYSEGGVEKTDDYEINITENTVTAGEYCITPNNEFWGTNFNGTISGDALNQVYTGRQDDITVQYSKGSGSNLYINNTQTRTYNGTALTIFAPNGYVITAIAFTADGSNWAGTHTANVGTMTDSKNWAGSANEVTITFGGTCRVTKICVTYEAAPVEPVKTLTSIEITTHATQTTFWQGETFNHNDLVVTAHYSDAEDEVVTPTVTGSTATAGTATVTVSYKEQSTSYTITVKAIPNTKETAYSVADAYDIIDKLTTAEGVFISGIISQVDSYNDTYKSITYWISTDGTTTKQLQVYSGKGLESADFTAVTDLTVGDQVIICGNLKKYSGTYEFDKNNYLASHTPTTKDPAGLEYATTEYTANVGEAFATPVLTNPNNLDVTYSTSDASKATVDVNTGAVTIVAAGEVTITASTMGDATHDAGSASYTITISNPAMAVATLPFAFNGKQADIANRPGMSHEGIDASDYGSAPYLKMNTTGDWLIIRFDSEPDKLSYDIKNNSFSGGTFSVQESADGETYTDVKKHTTIEGTQNEEHTLLSTSRYVKFVYTNKSTGNVGLGNIKITKYGEEPEQPGEGGGETALTDWVLTSAADITINDLVVITMTKGETTWAMTNNNGTTAAPAAPVVTLSADALAAEPDANLKWVVSNDNGTLTIYPYGGYETWLYCTNTNNGVRVGKGDAKEFTINANYLYTSLTTDPRHIGVYETNNDWRCYKPSSGAIATNIADQTLAFYVKKNANDVLPGTGEDPEGGEGSEDPVVPTPTINATATFIFNTAEGLNDLGIAYPTTEDEDNVGAYKTNLTDGASFTQDGITMTSTDGTTVTRVWLTAAGKLDLRVYKNATLTFSVPENLQIQTVAFDGNNINHLLVDGVAVSNNTWTGGKQEITFTAKADASTIKINTISFVIAYTRNVTNEFGTICLPYASASTSGAYFYEVVGKGTEKGKPAVYLASVNSLKAGVPYIFEKTANTIKVVYSSEQEDTPQNANGLIGNFTNEYVVPANNYILYNNAFIPADGTTNKVNAYRAYLDLSAVTGGAPQQMPGRRYIGMSVQGKNEATGFENITAPEGQAIKVIENGQLIIIRGGEKFNVQGQRL